LAGEISERDLIHEALKISTQVSFTGFSSEKMMMMRMVIYTLAI
jgi:hypothetical protein